MRSASGRHTARTGGRGRGRGNNFSAEVAELIPEATGPDRGGRVRSLGGRPVQSSVVGSVGAAISPQTGWNTRSDVGV